jgi:hypothetical protein
LSAFIGVLNKHNKKKKNNQEKTTNTSWFLNNQIESVISIEHVH